jgi:hypothetical protein
VKPETWQIAKLFDSWPYIKVDNHRDLVSFAKLFDSFAYISGT